MTLLGRIRPWCLLAALLLYLASVGAAAVRPFACDCFMRRHHHTHEHCCSHCIPADAHAVALTSPCCDDRHDGEAELYIASLSDESRVVRPAVLALLPALPAAEALRAPSLPPLRRYVRIRQALPDAPVSAGAGLRAPPVFV